MIDNGIVDIEKYLKDKFDYSFNGDLDEFYNKKNILYSNNVFVSNTVPLLA